MESFRPSSQDGQYMPWDEDNTPTLRLGSTQSLADPPPKMSVPTKAMQNQENLARMLHASRPDLNPAPGTSPLKPRCLDAEMPEMKPPAATPGSKSHGAPNKQGVAGSKRAATWQDSTPGSDPKLQYDRCYRSLVYIGLCWCCTYR